MGIERLMARGWQAAGPPERPALFVNPWSGDGAAGRVRLAERARERGIETVVLEEGQDLAGLCEAAVMNGADVLGVAGGDGSLSVAAAQAVAHQIPFVCIPAGTRNHFALDVGIDRHDVIGALEAFTAGVQRQIDIAEVNGRLFLNNVSLGIYGDAVERPGYRDAKFRTLVETARQVLGPSAQLPPLCVIDSAGSEHRGPAVVLVSNNPYAVDRPVSPGTRPALDTGQLGVLLLDAPGEQQGAPGRSWTAASLEVSAEAPLHAGVDGEAAELSAPLRFAIRPRALRVRISARHPGASPSALFPPP